MEDHVVEEGHEVELRSWIAERVRNTPWWALSIAFHALALACLGLITFSKEMLKPDVRIIEVGVRTPAAAPIDLAEAQRGLLNRRGAASEVPSFSEEPQPQAHHPESVESDKWRTKDDQETDGALGEVTAEGFVDLAGFGTKGRQLIDGPGTVDVTGVGGGGGRGSRFGTDRFGSNRWTHVPGCTKASEDAVMAGLKWLARHQGPDGGWHAETFAAGCAPGTACAGPGYKDFDVGLTGLALLAFLGAGYTHGSRDHYVDPCTHQKLSFGQCVRRGVKYLESQQDDQGCFGPRTGELLYNHAIATLAMAEAYGLTNAVQLLPVVERGIEFLSTAQNPYRGWRYTVKPGDNDTSVTGWCVMALKSAEALGIPTRSAYDGARSWLDSVTSEDGEVGYNGLGKVDVVVKGKNDAWRSHPSMTAIGLLSRIFIDKNQSDERLGKHAAIILKDLPRWDEDKHAIDFYYWYYGTLALFQYDGPDGRAWRSWNDAMMKALVPHQRVKRDGCADGSWDAGIDRWGYAGGRVYATAINVLTLEVYYRYEKAFGMKKPK